MFTASVAMPAALDALDAVHALLDRAWVATSEEMPPGPGVAWQAAFATAVAEVAANIILHASDPERPCKMSLRLDLFTDRLEAHFTDDGVPARLPDKHDPPDDVDESGRGLVIARHAVDEVRYERQDDANSWTLIKAFHEAQAATG